jgi:hypothetical protein
LTVAAWMVRSLMISWVKFVSYGGGSRILRACSSEPRFITVHMR